MRKRGLSKKREVNRVSFRIHILLLAILFLSTAVFGTLNVSLSDQGTGVTDKTTGELLGVGNLTVEVYDALTGGNLIYTESFESGILNGSWNVMLGENASNPLPLEFGKVYYRDYGINGEDVSFTNLTGDVVGRQFFYSPLGDVGSEDLADSAVSSSKLEQSINLSNATGYLWDNLFGIPPTFPSSTDKSADGFYLYNDTSTIYLNESQLNLTISAEASVYNDTGYVDTQLLNYYNKTEIYNSTESDERYLQNETDPIFVLENLSLWAEALNKFNSTYDTYAYNQTTPAMSYVDAQGYLTSGGANLTYLFVGENLTTDDWTNVGFVNDSMWNNSYLLRGENETDSVDWTNVAFLNDSVLNNTYLLVGENETGGSVGWDNVVFMNETLLNSTYLLKGENDTYNSTYDSWAYNMTTAAVDYILNQTYLSSPELNASYLLVGENETSGSYNGTYDLWAYNQTAPAVDWVATQGYLTSISWLNVVFINETFLNDTYLLKGENETAAASGDWTNVAFLNDSVFNNTYVTSADGNATYVRVDDINNSYLLVGENATADSYNATYDSWAYNQTTPAIDYVNAQGYLTSISWLNVVFINETLLNDTYLLKGENETAGITTYDPDLAWLNDSVFNNTYLRTGENETSTFLPADVVFANESLLNNTYVRLDNINSSYLLVGENESSGSYNSTYDTWAYNQTTPAMTYSDNTFLRIGENESTAIIDWTNVGFVNDSVWNTTFLFRGENETGGSVSWNDVVFMNETFLNNTYLLLDENASIWTAISNRLTSTEINDSYLLKGENESSTFLPTNVVFMNETLLNDTYLKVGENLTADAFIPANVVFLNESFLNDTFLFRGENETNNPFMPTDVVFDNESFLNSTYLLVGQNESNLFTPANVVFDNETLLNSTYLLKGENLTSDPDLSNAMFVNDTNINKSYLLKGENETAGSYNATYDLWAYNQTDASIIWVNEQAFVTSIGWADVAFINDSVFNNTYLFVGENETAGSYNATYDTWAYNQTTPAIDYFIANPFTYNASYDTWAYNMTTAAIDYCNANPNSYNQTYDTYAYNQTTPAISYADANFLTSPMLNASYLLIGENLTADSYNATYDLWAYNQTTPAIDYVDAQNYLRNETTINVSRIDLDGGGYVYDNGTTLILGHS